MLIPTQSHFALFPLPLHAVGKIDAYHSGGFALGHNIDHTDFLQSPIIENTLKERWHLLASFQIL